VWIKGGRTLGLVDPESFEVREVSNAFDCMEGGSLIIIAVLAGAQGNLMCLVSNRGLLYLLFYSFSQKTAFPRAFQEVTGQGRDNAFCLEHALEDGLFFLGGATDSNLKESDAKLLAVSFDKNMAVLDELIIRDQSEKKMAVTTMRRDRKRNVLYCGVYQDIYIVEFTGTHFCILKCIDNIHSCNRCSPRAPHLHRGQG